MSQAPADRNLLYGVLALQLNFISRDDLVAAMQAWVFDKSQSLGQILRQQRKLADDTHALLDALVQKHLEQHGNDAEKSLAAVSSIGSLHATLQQLPDPDLQTSLRYMTVAPQGDPSRPDLFVEPSVGQASAAGSRFRILRPHARGGLGEVLVARDAELNRDVALKQIQEHYAHDPDSQARFLLEAEITGGLEHPGIVPVYGMGAYADGRPFYAMRFIRGDSLKEAIERFHKADRPGRDPGERALELRGLLGRFVDVCNAVAYAHSRGILHRDLKPGNIMLGKYGETLVVDWGLAKPIGELNAEASDRTLPGEGTLMPSSGSLASKTLVGSAVGTPQFMSPEQAAGRLDQLGPASDVYSLGATLYSLLTGTTPFRDTDAATVLQKVQRGEFPPPRTVKPAVPPALEAICLKAMAPRPEDRYATPRDVADDVEHWLADEPVSAWPEPWTVRARRWMSRHRTLVTATAAAVLVAAVGLAVATVLLTAANERERAARELAEKRRVEAEHNFALARQAVDRYHTEVSESVLLHEPGMEPLRKKLLEAAREFYDRFVRERGPGDPETHVELGRALSRLAQITGDIGSEKKAIDLYHKALNVFESLPPEYDLPSREGLAVCWHHLGQLYRHTDQPGFAEKYYNQSLMMREYLTANKRVALGPGTQAEIARTLLGLGNVYQVTRRFDLARDKYRRAQAIRERLADDHPEEPQYQRDLAVTYANLALLDGVQGETGPADKAYRAAMAIQAKLVEQNPYISQYQNDLARTNFNLGALHAEAGEAGQAEAPYKEAIRLWDAVIVRHPAVTEFHVNVAESWAALAKVYATYPNFFKAEEACRKALKIQEKLAKQYADVTSYQDDLARGYYQLGNVYRGAGKVPQAEAAYADAQRILEKLVKDRPEVPQYQGDLARTYNAQGLLWSAGADADRADAAFQRSLARWDELTRKHPAAVEYSLSQAQTVYNLGNLVRKHGNPKGALDWYARALRAIDAIGPPEKRDAAARAALRNVRWKRAETLAELGRHAEALPDWDAALELTGEKERPWFQLYHAVALAHAGAPAKAVAEAEALAPQASKSGEALYQLVRVYALSAGKVANDGQRTADERQGLATQYATRAVELLEAARAAGYFAIPAHRARLQEDRDLESIRGRPAFIRVIEQIEKERKSA